MRKYKFWMIEYLHISGKFKIIPIVVGETEKEVKRKWRLEVKRDFCPAMEHIVEVTVKRKYK